jgi:hypothetical protein
LGKGYRKYETKSLLISLFQREKLINELWTVILKVIKLNATALMSRVHGRVSAVNASPTTWRWKNCRPALSPKKSGAVMTVLSNGSRSGWRRNDDKSAKPD